MPPFFCARLWKRFPFVTLPGKALQRCNTRLRAGAIDAGRDAGEPRWLEGE